MTDELTRFLETATCLCEEAVTWGGGTLALRVSYCLSTGQPPLAYVSSVRAIVFLGQSALVVTDKNGHMYILPGGRVEAGELPLETLRREVLEETGWTFRHPEPAGFMHFKHLGPKPEGYEYPYPDFIWAIFIADANRFDAAKITPDDWVSESQFRPVEEIRRLPLDRGELLLFEEALRMRRQKGVR